MPSFSGKMTKWSYPCPITQLSTNNLELRGLPYLLTVGCGFFGVPWLLPGCFAPLCHLLALQGAEFETWAPWPGVGSGQQGK
jgi:hypothetical protein